MSEATRRVRLRRWRPRGLSWAVLLIAGLAVGVAAESPVGAGLRLENPDTARVDELRTVLAQLPPQPLVLIGMDADLGTYPEIRPTVRAVLDELFPGGPTLPEARVAFVSFTTEGRAIAAAEVDRLLAGSVASDRVVDIGFVAGAEAGLVLSVTDLVTTQVDNVVARAIRARGNGIAAFDLAVLVGGTDFGPRSWVEQVSTRLPSLPLVAIVPTFAQPELAPYLRTGQLAALLGTVRDDAAYVADVTTRQPQASVAGERRLSETAMLLGLLVALAMIGRALSLGTRDEPDQSLGTGDSG